MISNLAEPGIKSWYFAYTCYFKHSTLLFTAQVMNGLKEGWFSELSSLWPGISLSLEVNEVLHSERSEYQDILVLET